MTIAQTIREQLGGNKFIAMTGARDFINHGNGLSFRLPKAANKITHIRISLVNDLYDVDFLSIRGVQEPKTLYMVLGISVENLQANITLYTGLHTSL